MCKVSAGILSANAGDNLKGLEELNKPGRDPWVLAYAANRLRVRAGATSMPGIGQILHPMSEPCFVLVLDLGPVLNFGVAVSALSQFLETPEGEEVYKKHSLLFKLAAHDTLVIPWGYLALPFTVNIDRRVRNSPPMTVWCLSTWKDSLRDACPANMKAALRLFNTSYLETKVGVSSYRERFEFFTTYMPAE